MTPSKGHARQCTLPLSVLLFSLVSRVAADQAWIYPVPNTTPSFGNNDTLDASWATDFPAPFMVLWCQVNRTSGFHSEFNVSVPASGSRLVPLDNYGNQGLSCHFQVGDPSVDEPSLNSPNFNIQMEGGNPTTWSLGSPSPPTTTASPSPAPTSALPSVSVVTTTSMTAAPTNTTSAQASPASSKATSSQGLGIGGEAGITIGVIIVVSAILAAVWYVYLRGRTRRPTDNEKQLEELAAAKAAELESSRATSEIGGREVRHEKFGYPVAVGVEEPEKARPQELQARPYWGRPF